MPVIRSKIDAFAVALAEAVIKRRFLTIIVAFLVTGFVASSVVNLTISNNYRVFFSKENPELTAFETFQAT